MKQTFALQKTNCKRENVQLLKRSY